MFKIILYAQAYETRCRPVEERQEEEDEEAGDEGEDSDDDEPFIFQQDNIL